MSESSDVLSLMLDARDRLPGGWDTDGFWLSAAQALAQFVADHEGTVATARLDMLTSIGGLLVAAASQEREACIFMRSALGLPPLAEGGPS